MYEKFGGGPVCNHPVECDTCKIRAKDLENRQRSELRTFSELLDEFQFQDSSSMIFAISMSWLRKWQSFARCETTEEPGPINNMAIAQQSDSLPIRNVKQGSDYAQINLKLWKFFFNIYGGGPDIILRGASEFSKSEREAELVDTTENLSLSDNETEEVVMCVDQPNVVEVEVKGPERQAEKETTSILKPVKTVSFEDASDAGSNHGSDEIDNQIDKPAPITLQVDRHQDSHGSRKMKKTIKLVELGGRERRTHHRSSEHGKLFGAEGTIRYVPDEDMVNGNVPSQVKTGHKPKRNGNDSDSDEEASTVSTETRASTHGHGHHRSSRKKPKSVRMK